MSIHSSDDKTLVNKLPKVNKNFAEFFAPSGFDKTETLYKGLRCTRGSRKSETLFPPLKPFDLSIRLNHLLTQGACQIPFGRIGPSLDTASFNESDLRLREGEMKKFARRTGGTNNVTSKTLSADEVIGELNRCKLQLHTYCNWPPWRNRKHFFKCFWDGSDPLPLPSFTKDRPEAKRAAEWSISILTPWNILGNAEGMNLDMVKRSLVNSDI
eukprot:scaffold16384_cov76-Cyclotella_meneghiniana.AAC.5